MDSKEFTYGAVWFLESHHVHDEGCGRDEEYLHQSVVKRNVVHEKIHVSHAENDEVDFLCFAG